MGLNGSTRPTPDPFSPGSGLGSHDPFNNRTGSGLGQVHMGQPEYYLTRLDPT